MLPCLSDALQVIILPCVAPPINECEGSAWCGCRANQSVTLPPRQTTVMDLVLQLPTAAGHAILLCSWSNITTQGGVIGSDYRVPIQCLLHNPIKTSGLTKDKVLVKIIHFWLSKDRIRSIALMVDQCLILIQQASKLNAQLTKKIKLAD